MPPPVLPDIAEIEEAVEELAPDFLSIEPTEGDNAADPASLRRKNKRSQRKMTARERWWHEAISTEVGREDIWDWLVKLGTFQVPAGVTPAGHPDVPTLMYRLGQKSAGDSLYHMLAALDRAAVLRMFDENDPTFQSIAKTKGYR